MGEELKAEPCPFCAADDITPFTWEGTEQVTVSCVTVGCPGGESHVLLAAWNLRPIESALRARVADLEAEKLRDARALALVDIALDGPEGVEQVRKMTGGNAPELVQGILDRVTVLTDRVAELEENQLALRHSLAQEIQGALLAAGMYAPKDVSTKAGSSDLIGAVGMALQRVAELEHRNAELVDLICDPRREPDATDLTPAELAAAEARRQQPTPLPSGKKE